MQLDGKKVLVVGTGKSGIAAIKLLAAKNADIVVLEGNKDADKNDIAQRIGSDISYDLIIGELPVQVMEKIDIAVLIKDGEESSKQLYICFVERGKSMN